MAAGLWCLALAFLLSTASVGALAEERRLAQNTEVERSRAALRLTRVDGSSFWLPKREYDRFKAGEELPRYIILEGEITAADLPVARAFLAPYLDPDYLKSRPKPSNYNPDPDKSVVTMSLNSEGGDVVAALELGRYLRLARATTALAKNSRCLSACVFLIAGAVHRLNLGGTIGIHRPYSDSTEAISFQEMQRRSTRLRNAVARYLRDMNIPNTLYEAMVRIPPETIKLLGADELESYGLEQDDPVFAELQRQAEARAAGLSMREYLPRKADYDRCVNDVLRQLPRGKSILEDWEKFGKGKDACLRRFILER